MITKIRYCFHCDNWWMPLRGCLEKARQYLAVWCHSARAMRSARGYSSLARWLCSTRAASRSEAIASSSPRRWTRKRTSWRPVYRPRPASELRGAVSVLLGSSVRIEPHCICDDGVVVDSDDRTQAIEISATLVGVQSRELATECSEIMSFVLRCRAMGRQAEETLLSRAVECVRNRCVAIVSTLYQLKTQDKPWREFFLASGWTASDGDARFIWCALLPYRLLAPIALDWSDAPDGACAAR
jgi:hypothetical protein